MRYIIVATDDKPLGMIDPSKLDADCYFLSSDRGLNARASRRGFKVAKGFTGDPEFYERIKLTHRDRVLIWLDTIGELNSCLDAIFSYCPEIAVTATTDKPLKIQENWQHTVRLAAPTSFVGSMRRELEKATSIKSVSTLRALFKDAEKVLLLLQDDPDPDGIASALALRAILGRNRLSAPIGSFGLVTRPENVAMVTALDVEVIRVEKDELDQFDKIALIDLQPYHSPDIPLEIDAVIDHHPRRSNYKATFKDIRPRYGATSTILTEYLLASHTTISQRLATALLYGIKTDTQLFGKDNTPQDVDAFASLYPLANHALLRRIDRPQIPRSDIASISAALTDAIIIDNIIFAHMGPLTREDVIPYFADLCLEIENAEWSVASGVFEGQLIMSVRNYGLGRSAGEVVKAAFEKYGSAGGHKAMAKAVIPLENLPPECLEHAPWISETFLEALNTNDSTCEKK